MIKRKTGPEAMLAISSVGLIHDLTLIKVFPYGKTFDDITYTEYIFLKDGWLKDTEL